MIFLQATPWSYSFTYCSLHLKKLNFHFIAIDILDTKKYTILVYLNEKFVVLYRYSMQGETTWLNVPSIFSIYDKFTLLSFLRQQDASIKIFSWPQLLIPQFMKEAVKPSLPQNQSYVIVDLYGILWFILQLVSKKLLHSSPTKPRLFSDRFELWSEEGFSCQFGVSLCSSQCICEYNTLS